MIGVDRISLQGFSLGLFTLLIISCPMAVSIAIGLSIVDMFCLHLHCLSIGSYVSMECLGLLLPIFSIALRRLDVRNIDSSIA